MSIWRWKNIYEKHLYDKIPLECEARQCYDADYDDSLSPLTFSGQWTEESSRRKWITTNLFCSIFFVRAYSPLCSPNSIHSFNVTASFWVSHHLPYSFSVGKTVRRICNSVRVRRWAPQTAGLQNPFVHFNPNSVLEVSVSALPQHFMFSLIQGVQGKVKKKSLRFSDQVHDPHPPPIHPRLL